MSILKNIQEIELIKKSSLLVSQTLGMLAKEIKPGITPLYLDNLAEKFIRDNGGIPAFLGLYGFPNTLCVSPNEQVVHGIPNKIPLKDGDIVSIDCGVLMNGYYGDQAYTFEVGNIDIEIKKLLEVTKKSLYLGIKKCTIGNTIGDIGSVIQNYVKKYNYHVVRELVGHGIGKMIHEEPQIPNYGKKGKGQKILEGMVLSIEPMINKGTHEIVHHKDRWTITTLDSKPSAHYEHNIAIINGTPSLLSTFKYIYESLGFFSTEEIL